MADSVCIFYLSDGEVWAKYLQERFTSQQYDISAELKPFRDKSAAKHTRARLNIMLITPELIETDDLDIRADYGGVTCVAVLTGVDHDSWSFAKKVLKLDDEFDWFIYELEEDADSARDLMVFIISLYESIGRKSPRLSWPESPSGTDTDDGKGEMHRGSSNEVENAEEKETDKNRPGSGGSLYDKLPSPRPLHAISHVFEKDDQVYLVIEGINNGLVEVKFRESAKSVKATQVSVKTTMYSFRHEQSMGSTFDVLLDTVPIGQGELTSEIPPDYDLYDMPPFRDSTSSGVSSRLSDISIDSISPRQQAPPPPTHHFGQSNSSYVNDQSRASSRSSNASTISPMSKLDQLQKLLSDVTDPISILCQSLKVKDDVAHLDEKLSQMMISTDALGVISCQSVLDSLSEPRDSIWPTLLHFGAHFGLWKSCLSLVNNPVTRPAAVVKNEDNYCPHEIAKHRGHVELAATLKRVADDVLNKNGDRESLVSLNSLQYQYPPPVPPRTPSMKGLSSEDEGTPKGILKRQSQSSLNSEDGYDSVYDERRSRQRDDSISISSNDSRVTFGPMVSEVDYDKTPVPRMDDPLNAEIRQQGSEVQGHNGIRTSNPISIPRPQFDEAAEAHRKDIAEYLGARGLSSSVPSSTHIHHYMKEREESHGFFERFRRKKTTSKSSFYQDEAGEREPEQRKSHSEKKTKVYRHKKGHHENDSSLDQDQEQFRSRLQTYPLPGQILRRPNVKKLKEKHAAAVNEIVWTGTEAGTNPHRVSKDDSHLPDVSLRHRDVHNSKEKKEKKDSYHRKKEHAKDHHKHKITWIVQQASKRTSTRFHVAQNDEHTSAPALPPRQPTLKNLGKF